MDNEIMIVILGIGLFLLAGLFGGLGISFILKNRRSQGGMLLGIGVLLVLIYIITLLILL
ncbi:lipopolysaccharide export LptBFGC system permease protein LptF [Evansella vedderi]|uniref:Lipopolysaccharide export LptBFGC system permease protein LptF n=1 Tax=Evansella vedderi TaxID=38282 RepID=A0ABU0A3J7_9BACI|nr:hypothetical protein [Evansella vedderi]MDQ0258058.1 lipopolysaccharide export LptBFGC system permease protein LptF [Evansella vedderi]